MNNYNIDLLIENEAAYLRQNGLRGAPVKEEKLVESLTDYIYPDIGILPPVVRWISPTRKYVLFERPPVRETIKFYKENLHNINGLSREYIFQLPLPWTLYAVEFDEDYYPIDISVYALRNSLESLNDRLGTLPLPNHYNSGALCMPSRNYNEVCNNIGEGIKTAYSLAWMSGFNIDLESNFNRSLTSMSPAHLFRSNRYVIKNPLQLCEFWEKQDLEDVTSWKDWLTPIGYGHDPLEEGNPNLVPRVKDLIAILQEFEYIRTNSDLTTNLTILIKRAFARAHLH